MENGRLGLARQDAGNGWIVENNVLWRMIVRIETICDFGHLLVWFRGSSVYVNRVVLM